MPARFHYSLSLGAAWTIENNLLRATIRDRLDLPMSIDATIVDPDNSRERTYTDYIRIRYVDNIDSNQIVFLGKADYLHPEYDDVYGQVLRIGGKDNLQNLLKQANNTNYTGFVQRSALIEQIVNDHRITGTVDSTIPSPLVNKFEDSVVVEPATQLNVNYLNSRKSVLRSIAELALEDPWNATPTGFGYDYLLEPAMSGDTPSPELWYFLRGTRPTGGASVGGLTVQYNTTAANQRLQMLPDYEFPKAAKDIRTICRIEYVDSNGANQSLRVQLIEISGGALTFAIGETITGGTSATTAVIQFIGSSFITASAWSGNFTTGETITGSSSGATRIVDRVPRQAFSINAESIITGYHVSQLTEARDKAASILYKSTNLSTRSITRGKFRIVGWPRFTRTSATIDAAVAEDSGVFVNETAAAQSAAANDMSLFPPLGTTGVNDAYYFGSLEKFDQITLNVGTAGVGTWTITYEIWNGAAWFALTGVTDSTTGFHVAGSNTITFTIPDNWSTTTVGGITTPYYYVRARISAFTNVATRPLGTQALFRITSLVRAGHVIRVTNSNVPIGSGVATLNEDMLVTSIEYDYGPGSHFSTIEVVETDRGVTISKDILKRLDEEIEDSQFANIGAAGGLPVASQVANTDMTFEAIDNDDIRWYQTAGGVGTNGTITWADGSSQTLNAGTLNLPDSSPRYLYVIEGTAALQNSTVFSSAIGINRTLIAIASRQSDTGFLAHIASINNGNPVLSAGTIIANRLSAISANMGLLTAGEVRVGTGTIGGTFAGFRIYPTAIEGYENIGGVSTLHVQISATDGRLRVIGGSSSNPSLAFESPINTLVGLIYADSTDFNIAASSGINLRLITSGAGHVLTGLAGAGITNFGSVTYYWNEIYGNTLFIQDIRRRSGAGGDIGSATSYFNTIWLGLQNRITSSLGDLLFQVANTAQSGQVTGFLIQDGDNPVIQVGSTAFFDFASRPHRNLRVRTSAPAIGDLETGELVLGDLGNTATDGRIWIKVSGTEIFEFTSTGRIT